MEIVPEVCSSLPAQCTRAFNGEEPAIQRFCYCVTCGQDSTKHICEVCAFNCHHGHNIFYVGKGPGVCQCTPCKSRAEPLTEILINDISPVPCLPADQLPYRCTYEHTKDRFFVQHSFRCITCDQKHGEGVCAICARVCHSGHKLIDNGISPFYCDCGANSIQGCPCLCSDKSKSCHKDYLSIANTTCGEDGNQKTRSINLPFKIPFKCTAKLYPECQKFAQRGFACVTCDLGDFDSIINDNDGDNDDENNNDKNTNNDIEAICEVCALKCHKGHEIINLGMKVFSCKCNVKDGKCVCLEESENKETFVPSLCAPDIEEGEEDCCCCCGCCEEEEEEEEGDEEHHHHCHCHHGGCGGCGGCGGNCQHQENK